MREEARLRVTGEADVVMSRVRAALDDDVIPDDVESLAMEFDVDEANTPFTVEAKADNPKELVGEFVDGVERYDPPQCVEIRFAKACDATGTEDPDNRIDARTPDGGVGTVPVGDGDEGDGDERELAEISPGTNHHEALRAIVKAGSAITTGTVASRTDLTPNSIGSTCRTLWERKLVERHKTESSHHEFEYRPTSHGHAVLRGLEGDQ